MANVVVKTKRHSEARLLKHFGREPNEFDAVEVEGSSGPPSGASCTASSKGTFAAFVSMLV